jgi:hypothetical protein
VQNKSAAGYSHYDTGEEVGGTLSIRYFPSLWVNDTPLIDVVSIWSRKRQILDEFVQAARQFYIDSKVLPRKVEREKEPVGVPISLGALDSLLRFQLFSLVLS